MCALLCTAVADPAEWQGYGGTQKHFSPSQAMASEPLRVHSSRLPQAWSLQQSPHQSPPGKWMRNTTVDRIHMDWPLMLHLDWLSCGNWHRRFQQVCQGWQCRIVTATFVSV